MLVGLPWLEVLNPVQFQQVHHSELAIVPDLPNRVMELSRTSVRIRERLSNSQLYFVDSLSGQVVQIHNVAFKPQGPGETIQIQFPKHPKFVSPFVFDFELLVAA